MGRNRQVVEPQEEYVDDREKRVLYTSRYHELCKSLVDLGVEYELWELEDGQRKSYVVEFYMSQPLFNLLMRAHESLTVMCGTQKEVE